MWLLLIFIIVPIIEIGLFIQVGGQIGLLPTLAIVVLTAIIGTTVMRRQGLSTMAQLQDSLQHGGDPSGPMAHGALLLVSGLLLLTPGFFTDAVGMCLLVPAIRSQAIRQLKSRFSAFVTTASNKSRQQRHAPSDIIDGEFTPVDEDDQNPGSSGWTKRP